MYQNSPQGLAQSSQQVATLAQIPCPACGEKSLVSLSQLKMAPTAVLPGGKIQGVVSVGRMDILCFHCLYRARWEPRPGGRPETTWESEPTAGLKGEETPTQGSAPSQQPPEPC